MKLCKDCKHYGETLQSIDCGPWEVVGRDCAHPECVDMVTGEPTDCASNRTNGPCWMAANYWEAK